MEIMDDVVDDFDAKIFLQKLNKMTVSSSSPPLVSLGTTSATEEDDPYLKYRDWKTFAPFDKSWMNQLYYKTQNPKRGYAIIFDNAYFHGGAEYRPVVETDCRRFENALKALEFEVKMYVNLSVSEIERAVMRFTMLDHDSCDALCIVILTHGGREVRASDAFYDLGSTIVAPFDPALKPVFDDRPKIFITQIYPCPSGDVEDQRLSRDMDPSYGVGFCWPLPVDSFLVRSAGPIYTERTGDVYGSFFVQSLCEHLVKFKGVYDLLSTVRQVNNAVAEDIEKNRERLKGSMCRKALVASAFTRLLVFETKN